LGVLVMSVYVIVRANTLATIVGPFASYAEAEAWQRLDDPDIDYQICVLTHEDDVGGNIDTNPSNQE
jgi:hypothetical protein